MLFYVEFCTAREDLMPQPNKNKPPREIVKRLRFGMKVGCDGYIICIIIKYNLFTFAYFSFPAGVWFGVCGFSGITVGNLN